MADISNAQAGPPPPPPSPRIRLGICAMDKKARGKPMNEIVKRLDPTLFEAVYFGDNLLLNDPIETWPVCDVLIAFFSNGYPLEKAEAYADLRKPYMLNDLGMQRTIMDRRKIYDLLVEGGIDVPRHVYASRDGYVTTTIEKERNGGKSSDLLSNLSLSWRQKFVQPQIEEHDDYIVVDGTVIHKPFVEKPVDADDHNIWIFYPSSAGGGCKKLFRKIGDKSSDFFPDVNEIRREGSYIYEAFMETQGTDVKMYTVGPDYGHAEARKSPAIDGKVTRNKDGKEVRFPVILTMREKEIARRITLVFRQLVCGFDILRIQEGDSLVSLVIDVNGWSAVKNSKKYYDDCALILSEHVLAKMQPKAVTCISALSPLMTTVKNLNLITSLGTVGRIASMNPKLSARHKRNSTTFDAPVSEIPHELALNPASLQSMRTKTQTHQEELRCVITIIRHGDRTPKQKLKRDIESEDFLKYFEDHSKNAKALKIKEKNKMLSFLELVNASITKLELQGGTNPGVMQRALQIRSILERSKITGLNRKIQMKPRKWEETPDGAKKKVSALQLIVKWGGDLTILGEKQAERLGNRLREELYPSNNDGGILRLHSTFRHDMKIRTSDEGRVMKTAAAFTKGMLELEGDLPPILVSLVHKEKDSLHMLDHTGHTAVEADLKKCKDRISILMTQDINYADMTKEMRESLVGPECLVSLHRSLKKIGNPRKALAAIYSTIGNLCLELEVMFGGIEEDVVEGGHRHSFHQHQEVLSGIKLYKGESLQELYDRWTFVQDKFYDRKKDRFDLSTIPDVHDNARFDMLHNRHLGLTETLSKLYDLAKDFADCIVPQEYGQTIQEKRGIGTRMCRTLLEKINYDLKIAREDNQVDMRYLINMDYSADLSINSMGRRVRSRLYFTSESHLHSLLNVLRFTSSAASPLSQKGQDIIASASELCYLTQVVIRLFEDHSKPVTFSRRFRVEIMFSPGATATPLHMAELDKEQDDSRFDTEKLQVISIEGLTCEQVEAYFAEAIKEGETEEDDGDANSIPPPWHPATNRKKEEKTEKKEEQTKSKSDMRQTLHRLSSSTWHPDTDPDHPSRMTKVSKEVDKFVHSKNFRRAAAVLGVTVGAGCLIAMLRTFKPRAR